MSYEDAITYLDFCEKEGVIHMDEYKDLTEKEIVDMAEYMSQLGDACVNSAVKGEA